MSIRPDVVEDAIRNVATAPRPTDRGYRGHPEHHLQHRSQALGVGVATGKYTVEELAQSGARRVFEDFEDWPGSGARTTFCLTRRRLLIAALTLRMRS